MFPYRRENRGYSCAVSTELLLQCVCVCVLQVHQLCHLLDALLETENVNGDELEAFFLQSLYWSLGAGLLEDGRVKFDHYVKNTTAMPTIESDAKHAKAGGRTGTVLRRVLRYSITTLFECTLFVYSPFLLRLSVSGLS